MIMGGDSSRISSMINSLGLDVRNLLTQAVEIAWFSRGSIQYDAALLMTPLERDITIQFVNKNIENQKKKSNPIY